MIDQLLREWPPGFGGVERVAHELACIWAGTVYSLDAQGLSMAKHDPLPVPYVRRRLPVAPPFGRLLVPLPSRELRRMLFTATPLHGHLPSPAVLLLLLLARLLQPRRSVTAHWHCFLEPGPGLKGIMFGVYQWLALRCLPLLSGVITTSPLLCGELVRCGCPVQSVFVLPCCLNDQQEKASLAITRSQDVSSMQRSLRVLFIGRLDSYKRLDWLLRSLLVLRTPWRLDVVGDGPKRHVFEALSQQLFKHSSQAEVHFHGRLLESAKLDRLSEADLLVLPSDRSNEAFGIVQLEAMAAGIPALAFQRHRSGMGWVGQLPGLEWSQTPEALPGVLQGLASDPSLCCRLGVQARLRYMRLFSREVWLRDLKRLRGAFRQL